jgi:hypothetical protein
LQVASLPTLKEIEICYVRLYASALCRHPTLEKIRLKRLSPEDTLLLMAGFANPPLKWMPIFGEESR